MGWAVKGNPFASLYGAGHVDANEAEGKDRQTRLTPPEIISAIRRVWTTGIALDPCAAPGGSSWAELSYTGPAAGGVDGLTAPWMNHTFFNPPYGDLRPWLGKGIREARVGHEVMGLVPLRTKRPWFKLELWHRVCLLKGVTFIGYDADFPEPCVILYRGKHLELFQDAFASLGRVGTFRIAPSRQGDLFS